jgi:hypothetical protein
VESPAACSSVLLSSALLCLPQETMVAAENNVRKIIVASRFLNDNINRKVDLGFGYKAASNIKPLVE